MSESILFWRRTDVEGLERLELAIGRRGVSATSSVLCLEAGGFRLDHRWRLDAGWRAALALAVFEDRDAAARFLMTEHPELEGRTPFDVALTEIGGREVEEIIARGLHGLPA